MSEVTQSDKMARRKQQVQAFCDRIIAEGYTAHDLTITAESANTIATITTLPFVVVYAVAFGLIAGWKAYTNMDMGLLSLSIFASIVIHELIHGLFFGMFSTRKFRAIEFGVLWKTLNPYCYCSDPVTKVQYLIAVTMPGFILGGVVGIAAIIAGSATWLVFSLVAFLSASGDFAVAVKILQFDQRGKKALFLDHPEKPGLLVFTKE